MRYFQSVAVRTFAVASLLLSGCAHVGIAPVLPSALPLDKPITPVVVYVTDCGYKPGTLFTDKAKKGTFFCSLVTHEFMAYMDKHADSEKVRVVKAGAGSDKNLLDQHDKQFFTPDRELEKSIHAVYRIRLQPLMSVLHVTKLKGVIQSENGITTGAWGRVTLIPKHKVISFMALQTSGEVPKKIGRSLARQLLDGVRGPRCPYYNPGVFERWPKTQCNNISLPALDEDGDPVDELPES